MQRDRARQTCRSSLSAASSGRGFGTRSSTAPSAVATVARRRTPTSTPTREPGSVTFGCCGRCTRTRTLASIRVPLRRTVIASTRDRPLAMSRSTRRVFSWVRTVPMTGSVRWLRSGSTRIAPVVNVTRSGSRPFFLNRGKPILLPSRLPDREFCQFQYASTAPSIPSA
ncbi:Uncharacterised protein [Mycobacterium tuberculosis]|uniref:Uncharacterized protein n=1 Tax=Mycobacterium tuberculosis TaxID=1773 RepID=A0A0U0RB58_MYCTX|nr:Uncharacterised protein [Mycobacterium tuberculosis]COW25224.1 Uncharacterised protein [Mycobacterium tuberculosis]